MAVDVFWDTSGFFALLNTDDPQHAAAKSLAAPAMTTDGIIGECCTLLVARKKPHLVATFLDFTERSTSLRIIHLDEALIAETKAFLRRHLDHSYSFVDCSSFIAMTRLGVREAATTDAHFIEAGFTALLR